MAVHLEGLVVSGGGHLADDALMPLDAGSVGGREVHGDDDVDRRHRDIHVRRRLVERRLDDQVVALEIPALDESDVVERLKEGLARDLGQILAERVDPLAHRDMRVVLVGEGLIGDQQAHAEREPVPRRDRLRTRMDRRVEPHGAAGQHETGGEQGGGGEGAEGIFGIHGARMTFSRRARKRTRRHRAQGAPS